MNCGLVTDFLKHAKIDPDEMLITCTWTTIGIAEAQFLVPDRGDLVDSGKGLLYNGPPTGYILYRLAGRYDNYPMPNSTISASQGLRIWLQVAKLIMTTEAEGRRELAYHGVLPRVV
jgi:hypothetical protein